MASTVVVSALNNCEKSIISSFKSLYDFIGDHRGNKKVFIKDLRQEFDCHLKTLVTEIEKLKTNDNNSNVDSEVNNLLSDIITEDVINEEINGQSSQSNNSSLENPNTNEANIGSNESPEQTADSFESISQRLSRIESVLNLRPIHLKPKKKINQNNGQKQRQKSGSNTNWRQNSNSNQKSRVFYGSDKQNNNKNMYFERGRQFRPPTYPQRKEWHNFWPAISDYHPYHTPKNWNQMTVNRIQPNYWKNSYLSQRPENNHFLGRIYRPIVRHF